MNGKKTYTAAIGLVGLAVYQLTQGQYDQAIHQIFLALGMFGLRWAIAGQQMENVRFGLPEKGEPEPCTMPPEVEADLRNTIAGRKPKGKPKPP
jgi:hypothetical protein